MVACVECGKKLGFFEGHYHPTLGKKSLVCGPCFMKIDESVTRWRKFVLSNSFNPKSYVYSLSFDWKFLFNNMQEFKNCQKQLNRKRVFKFI